MRRIEAVAIAGWGFAAGCVAATLVIAGEAINAEQRADMLAVLLEAERRRSPADPERCLRCGGPAEAIIHVRFEHGLNVTRWDHREQHQFEPVAWHRWTPEERAEFINRSPVHAMLMDADPDVRYRCIHQRPGYRSYHLEGDACPFELEPTAAEMAGAG